ncbi:MAG: hypothetical protein SCM57_09285, partial [Bacillota bacterium]|nr:hypothetical protein [Bacillota bacterium]
MMFTIRIKGKYIVPAAALVLVLSVMLYSAAARAVSLRELELAQQSQNLDEYIHLLRDLYPNPEDATRELYNSAMDDAGGGGGQQRNMV